jgi:aspartate carbamoyltransferase catalytic subunit
MDLAKSFRDDIREGREIKPLLKSHGMVQMFFEVSTRTRCSFEVAMKRLGGFVTVMDVAESSMQKGESLQHATAVMTSYVNKSGVLVIRHPEKGAVQKAADFSVCPVINGGDGIGEHPSQVSLVYKNERF